jgi:hypothetical protein
MTGSGTKRKMLDCPCCGAQTLTMRGVFEICRRCGWEDDPSQAADPEARGGANAQSLNEARAAWAARTA